MKAVISTVALIFVIYPNFGQAQQSGRDIYEIIAFIQAEILDPLITFFFILASLLFIWGVIEFLFVGASNEQAKTQGKKHMLWGITGLLIMFGVNIIISVITAFFLSV